MQNLFSSSDAVKTKKKFLNGEQKKKNDGFSCWFFIFLSYVKFSNSVTDIVVFFLL